MIDPSRRPSHDLSWFDKQLLAEQEAIDLTLARDNLRGYASVHGTADATPCLKGEYIRLVQRGWAVRNLKGIQWFLVITDEGRAELERMKG